MEMAGETETEMETETAGEMVMETAGETEMAIVVIVLAGVNDNQ